MAEKRSTLPARSILGFAIVVLGVLLTLDNLGWVEFDDFWQYWPVLLLLVGLSKATSGEPGKGFFWLAIGTLLLLPSLFEAFDWERLWEFWPLALIAAGLHMVVRSFAPRRNRQASIATHDTGFEGRDAPSVEVEAFAFLSTVRRRVEEVDFSHGELTAVLGACELDLSRAELPPEGAVVEVFAFWGGVEIRVPEHWALDPQVAVFMGGIEDKTRQQAAPRGRLVIKGFALMGGLEIRN